MDSGDDGERLQSVAFTCRLTAGYRCVESTSSPDPVIHDVLACNLAGPKALKLAQDDWKQLQDAQGPGKHYRVAARSRIIDDALMDFVSSCKQQVDGSHTKAVTQVVCLGSGMDTRPWRLPLGRDVAYFEVDQDDVLKLKVELLKQAHAQLDVAEHSDSFPLHAGSWIAVAVNLTGNNLESSLHVKGFDPTAKTVWIAEGLLYYLQLPEAVKLMSDLARCCAPGSRLLATCIDAELLYSHRKLTDHAFANLWNFCMDDLRGEGDSLLETGWRLCAEPATTRSIALECYNKETYVPVSYGGHEHFFAASC